MKRSLRTSLAAGMLAPLALIACQDTPAGPSDTPSADAQANHAAHAAHAGHKGSAKAPAPALVSRDMAALRRATARYHRVDAALADGFQEPPADECVAAPPGGMGFHYVDPDRIDLNIDPTLPEALLYEPTDNGRLRLVAAEFLVHGNGWDAANPGTPPTFAGAEFDPPTDRSATAPPGAFYTLHVWIWKDNPSGIFAPFNPRVSCD